MGLGKFLSRTVAPLLNVAGAGLSFINPPLGTALTTFGGAFGAAGPPMASPFQPAQASVPSIQAVTGVPSFLPSFAAPAEAAVVSPAQGAGAELAIMGMTREVALTISKLASRLGIPVALRGLSRVGGRIYQSLVAFARRHPNISLAAMLSALGLVESEIASFLTWGSTRRRRRRRGGISTRDMRVARRTIRRISSFQHDLSHLRAHAGGFRARGVRGRGGYKW